MILGSFKNFISSGNWLRFALALIFISAGIFRIFNPAAAAAELANLQLPSFLTWIILVIEIGGGILLFLGKQIRLVSFLFIVFLIIALVAALAANGLEILAKAHQLFVFNLEPTDFFLHVLFLLLLIALAVRHSR